MLASVKLTVSHFHLALEHALNGVTPADKDDRLSKSTKYNGPDEDTIAEEVEPLTPGPRQHFPSDVRK